MSQVLEIHPTDPQDRLIQRVVDIIRGGGVVVYPTDSCYALGCHIGDKDCLDRIRRIRRLDKGHQFTLVCRDLSDISTYAPVSNQAYRLLKKCTPGPYTFVLRASREVPKRLQDPRRKTIGIRVPDHPVAQALLTAHGAPLTSSTVQLPGADWPLADPTEIVAQLDHAVDAIIDAGGCGVEPTTVVDLTSEAPRVLRSGRGPVANLGLDQA